MTNRVTVRESPEGADRGEEEEREEKGKEGVEKKAG